MKEFIKRLNSDKEFAAEFKEFLTAKNQTVREGTRLVGEHLNKLVMSSVKEFAASKGMTLKDDEQTAVEEDPPDVDRARLLEDRPLVLALQQEHALLAGVRLLDGGDKRGGLLERRRVVV